MLYTNIFQRCDVTNQSDVFNSFCDCCVHGHVGMSGDYNFHLNHESTPSCVSHFVDPVSLEYKYLCILSLQSPPWSCPGCACCNLNCMSPKHFLFMSEKSSHTSPSYATLGNTWRYLLKWLCCGFVRLFPLGTSEDPVPLNHQFSGFCLWSGFLPQMENPACVFVG